MTRSIHYTVIGPHGTSFLCAKDWPSERDRLWKAAERAVDANERQRVARDARLFNEGDPVAEVQYIVH